MNREELIRLWEDPIHWRWWGYYCPEDPRVIVPKSRPWAGWTINFAHPAAWPALLVGIAMAVGPTLALLAVGVTNLRWLIAALVASLATVITVSYHLSGRTHPEALPPLLVAVVGVLIVGLWVCRAILHGAGQGDPWRIAVAILLAIAVLRGVNLWYRTIDKKKSSRSTL